MDQLQKTIEWPARFPDLSSFDLLWGHSFKSAVYKNKSQNIDEFQEKKNRF